MLPDVVSDTQGAFLAGRSILHNVLICQDLVNMYRRSQTIRCCMFMLDIQKAYDTVEWEFIQETLLGLEFPVVFTGLIMTCVKSPSFTLMLNGVPTGVS